MTAAAQWLRRASCDAPPALLQTMLAALPAGDAAVPEVLAEGALALLRQAAAGSGGREAALPLLAADALLTQALQAQAELDAAALPAFAARLGAAGRLGEIAREVAAP